MKSLKIYDWLDIDHDEPISLEMIEDAAREASSEIENLEDLLKEAVDILSTPYLAFCGNPWAWEKWAARFRLFMEASTQ